MVQYKCSHFIIIIIIDVLTMLKTTPWEPSIQVKLHESSCTYLYLLPYCCRQEEHDDHEDFLDSFQGNSLGARSGWSSAFEHQANTPTSPEASLPGASPTSRTALGKSVKQQADILM